MSRLVSSMDYDTLYGMHKPGQALWIGSRWLSSMNQVKSVVIDERHPWTRSQTVYSMEQVMKGVDRGTGHEGCQPRNRSQPVQDRRYP